MALPYQPVRGVCEVRMRYIYDGENCENVYHVAHASLDPWVLVAMEDLASTFISWEDTEASEVRSVSCALNEVIVTDLTSLTTKRVTRSVVPQVVGAVIGDSLPNNATIAIKADINNRGRGKNGRVFFIGLAESQVTKNTLTDVARDAITSKMTSLITAVETLNPAYDLVTVHRIINGVRPAEADYSPIASYSMSDLTIDSQKNRLPNHRRRRRTQTPA